MHKRCFDRQKNQGISLGPKEHETATLHGPESHQVGARKVDDFLGMTLLGAPGHTTRSKDATRGSWPYY